MREMECFFVLTNRNILRNNSTSFLCSLEYCVDMGAAFMHSSQVALFTQPSYELMSNFAWYLPGFVKNGREAWATFLRLANLVSAWRPL